MTIGQRPELSPSQPVRAMTSVAISGTARPSVAMLCTQFGTRLASSRAITSLRFMCRSSPCTDLPLGEPLAGCHIAARQQDGRDARTFTYGRRQFADHFL